jgi:ribose 5-phosphate isomerase B
VTGRPSEDEIRALVRQVLSGAAAAEGEPDAPSDVDRGLGRDPSGAATIAIGADHGGFRLKERLAFRLREQGWDVHDCGTDSTESVDYPDFAAAVARRVASGESTWGIVVDGAGIGSCIAANKIPGVRASLCYDISSARNAREHNHANVLTLGAGLVGDGLAAQIVEAWLETPWGAGRHARRVAMITDMERAHLGAPERTT